MDAPKCKTCGKVEWRHVCGGLECVESVITTARVKSSSSPKKGPKLPAATEPPSEESHGPHSGPIPANDVATGTSVIQAPKTDRKEYLKLKARERRAATAAGLTVKQWRERK